MSNPKFETREIRALMEEARKTHEKLLKVTERLERKLADEVPEPPAPREPLRNGQH